MDSVGAVVSAAGEALTARELGSELSRRISPVVPHDGYLLVVLDPVTGAGCLVDRQNWVSAGLRHRLEIEEFRDGAPYLLERLFTGPRQVQVIGAEFFEDPRYEHLHDDLRNEGYGQHLRLALRHRGVAVGWLGLSRERGSRLFSERDTVRAQRLAKPLTDALRRFFSAKPLRPGRCPLPPGIVIVDRHHTVVDATPAGRAWLSASHDFARPPGAQLPNDLLNITLIARRPGPRAVSRVPTPDGWLSLSAEPLGDRRTGNVAVTLQAASAGTLLPALCHWYGITAGERSVLEQALRGLPVKQIARRLGLSSYTVYDHFKSIYRKTGVAGRDELMAGVSAQSDDTLWTG
ncbi:helix-turn-helix transcriptional regulator [Amycolatopsis magusensis]|uniref:helix-turn-helix transcriptional regulator n=1 Tax=Amycolatopsis magusensis TaxID=882444 RepID=UPI0037A7A33D